MKRKFAIVGIIAMLSISSIAAVVLASGTTTIILIQPVNKTISGTYNFEAKVVTSVIFSDLSGTFTIDGTAYTVAFVKTGTIDTYIAETGFNTGTLPNGAYSWYATINGATSGTASFTIHNYININPISPVAGSTVAGIYQFSVSTSSTAGETVNSVTMNIQGNTYTMVETSTNEWAYTINSFSMSNGQVAVLYSASGSGGVSGSKSITIDVNNPVSSNYKVEYLEGTAGYNATLAATVTSASLSTEGFYSLANGFLSLQPNSKVTSIIITPPNTIPGLHFMFFPFTLSPYYKYSASSFIAYNWTVNTGFRLVPYTNPTVVSITTSQFGFPICNVQESVSGSGGIEYTGPTAGNLMPTITSNWTVGGVFEALTNTSYMIGTNSLHFYTIPLTSNSFYPAVNVSTSAGTYYQIVSNISMTTKTWFSMSLGIMPQSNNLTKDTIWIDGTPVPTHVVGAIVNGQTINGMGYIMYTSNVSFFDFYSVNSLLSTTDVQYISQPEMGQIPNGINPPFYTITQDYYQIQITNGTQPWSSSFLLNVEQFNGEMPSDVSINLGSPFGYQSFTSYNVTMTYYPYFSILGTSGTLNTGFFTLPEGSRINITISNVWDQIVGSYNTTITSSAFSATIFLNLALLSFQYINATEQFITLTANNVTEQFYAQAYVGMGYTYFWNSTIYSNGQNIVYSGNVTVTQVNQPLYIYGNPPPATVSVIVFAYNGSGLTQVSTGAEPGVLLFVDGHRWQTLATYNTTVGRTISLRVADYLNQTLYASTFYVANTQNTLSIDITTPSYILSLKNDEQANTSSPKATEIIKVTNNATKVNATFTDAVGQTLALYLLEANYTLYLHDNATFTTSVYLNQSSYYVIFGQKLVTLSLFTKDMQQILNNSAKLTVTPLRQPSQLEAKLPYSFEYTISFSNGTLLTHLQIYDIIENSTFSIYLSNDGTSIQGSLAVINKTLYANFTVVRPGQIRFIVNLHQNGSYVIVAVASGVKIA